MKVLRKHRARRIVILLNEQEGHCRVSNCPARICRGLLPFKLPGERGFSKALLQAPLRGLCTRLPPQRLCCGSGANGDRCADAATGFTRALNLRWSMCDVLAPCLPGVNKTCTLDCYPVSGDRLRAAGATAVLALKVWAVFWTRRTRSCPREQDRSCPGLQLSTLTHSSLRRRNL